MIWLLGLKIILALIVIVSCSEGEFYFQDISIDGETSPLLVSSKSLSTLGDSTEQTLIDDNSLQDLVQNVPGSVLQEERLPFQIGPSLRAPTDLRQAFDPDDYSLNTLQSQSQSQQQQRQRQRQGQGHNIRYQQQQ